MKNIFIIFISFLLLLSSCKRTVKEGIVGPEIKTASSSFLVLDSLKANYFDGFKVSKSDTISFSYTEEIPKFPLFKPDGFTPLKKFDGKDSVPDSTDIKFNYYKRSTFFKVKFNEEVSWNITLTKFLNGQKDNSIQKTLSGTSSFLDSSNSAWNGNGEGTLFATGDHVIAELSFVNGSSVVLRDTLFISKGAIYKRTEAELLIDFESGLISTYPYIDDKDPSPSPMPSIDYSINTPQGEASFRLYGKDNNGDYFLGGVNIQKLDTETMKNYNPRDIYLNMFIYGYPSNNPLEISSKATKLNIGFSEKDNPMNLGTDFDPLTEDTFEKQISVDWVGWKLISIRYADLVPSGSKTNGGSGNGRFEPGKVFSANCNLISSPNGSIVGANIDYVIITYGQPFDANSL
jgi:hypothetical protein